MEKNSQKKQLSVKAFIILLAMSILIPACVLACCGFLIPPKYNDTFTGELKYKYKKLYDTKGKKIVLIGGSACVFGVDSELMEKELSDYKVVNFGMYAALGSRFMLDLAADSISDGDIVIFMPEPNEQMLSDFFDAELSWQAMDGSFYMLKKVDSSYYGSLIGTFPHFAFEKLRYQLSETYPETDGVYMRKAFNSYGEIEHKDVSANIMPDYYDPTLPITYGNDILDDSFADELNSYAKTIERKGAHFYYHSAPVDRLALTEDADPDKFYKHIKKTVSFPLLGDPNTAVMDEGWFYDTNFHLNAAGKTVFTAQLIRDIKVVLSDTSSTDIELPAKPKPASTAGHVLDKASYSGNTSIKEITVKKDIRSIEDKAFYGCTSLRVIKLESDKPANLIVGSHLLDGTTANLYVPDDSVSLYKTDYRFSVYSDRIKGYSQIP